MALSLVTNRSIFCRQALAFGFATAFLLLRPVMADPILDLVMNDPSSLLSSQPDGLTRLTSAFSSSKATIASGFGGRAVPQLVAAASGESADAKVQILSEPAMGSGKFFRATLNGASEVKQVGLGILPDKEGSLQTFVTRENSQVRLSGAFDFLFRASSNNGAPKFQISTKVANLSVTVGTNPGDGALTLKIYTSARSLAVNTDKTGKRAMIEKRSELQLENDAIYHGAVIFKTAADGSQIVTLCISHGPGAIDTQATVAALIEGFDILEDASSKEMDKVTISLSREGTSQQTLDIAAFRVFKSVPDVLPDFAAKAP